MLQEMNVKDALRKYIAGREVLVLEKLDDAMDVSSLGIFLENPDLHYLVDVPAVDNPDFNVALDSDEFAASARLCHETKSPERDKNELEPVAETPKKEKSKHANKKIDDKEAARMLQEGKTQKQIAEHFGVSPGTMSIWVKHYRAAEAGRRCGTCKYREMNKSLGNCNYLGITGHSRGCDPEHCTVYEKGNPVKRKVAG